MDEERDFDQGLLVSCVDGLGHYVQNAQGELAFEKDADTLGALSASAWASARRTLAAQLPPCAQRVLARCAAAHALLPVARHDSHDRRSHVPPQTASKTSTASCGATLLTTARRSRCLRSATWSAASSSPC